MKNKTKQKHLYIISCMRPNDCQSGPTATNSMTVKKKWNFIKPLYLNIDGDIQGRRFLNRHVEESSSFAHRSLHERALKYRQGIHWTVRANKLDFRTTRVSDILTNIQVRHFECVPQDQLWHWEQPLCWWSCWVALSCLLWPSAVHFKGKNGYIRFTLHYT